MSSSPRSVAIVWLRNDLRIHDNYALYTAVQELKHRYRTPVDVVLPVFCFDPRQVDVYQPQGGTTLKKPGPRTFVGGLFPKCGSFRFKFLWESVCNLRANLQKQGSDLLLARGPPEQVLSSLVKHLSTDADKQEAFRVHSFVYQPDISSEERSVEQAVEAQVLEAAGTVQFYKPWGWTLFHRDDVPFAPDACPSVFTQFRKAVETRADVRECLLIDTLAFPPAVPSAFAESFFAKYPHFQLKEPAWKTFCDSIQVDERGCSLEGGETAGLARLRHYLAGGATALVSTYKDTRNGLIGLDYSSKFSAYLAHGCVSPRTIYHAIRQWEKENPSNQTQGPYWLIFELLWRDFFKFIGLQHGDRLFYLGGLNSSPKSAYKELAGKRKWSQDPERFRRWREGETGIPWVDAGMRELKCTGYLSNRMRQNVASFLVHSLGMDWRLGATWFESVLVDHDVHANYGNWQYVAGVGNDPRESRKFNMIKQAKDYDPQGDYVKLWCPELRDFPPASEYLFMPWKFYPEPTGKSLKELGVYGCQPIILEPEWERHAKGNGGARRGNNKKPQPNARNGKPRGSDWKIQRNT